MKRVLSERNLAVVLFILVLITFALAQEDTKKMERIQTGTATQAAASMLVDFNNEQKNND
jgi:hypothetical protein